MKIRIEFARLGQEITSCFLYGEHDVTEFLNVFLFHYHKDGFAKNIVYLLSIEDGGELFVTQNVLLIKELLEGKVASCLVLDKNKEFVIFLQEYESYEDAYEVALSIKETNPLCYNNPNNQLTTLDLEKMSKDIDYALENMTEEEIRKYFPADTRPKGWLSIEEYLPMMRAIDFLEGGTLYKVKDKNGNEFLSLVSDHNVWYYMAKEDGITHWWNGREEIK